MRYDQLVIAAGSVVNLALVPGMADHGLPLASCAARPSSARSGRARRRSWSWGCDLVFPRTLTHLKADRTQRVSRAFYRSGDLMFGQGEPASDFYVVKEGEVEILNQRDGSAGAEVIAVLMPGDFFGEGALIDARPRRNSARARTNVEVLVLGGSVFNQLSTAFTPMKAALAAALKRRTPIWQRFRWAREVLADMPVDQFVEPIEVEPLKLDSSLLEAVGVINSHRLDVCFVAGAGSSLAGLLTRGDLLRAIDVAAALPAKERANLKVKDIMMTDPRTVSSHDTALSAVNTMREHGLTKLPVVEVESDRALKGYVRLENIMESVLRKRLALGNAVDE